MLDLGNKTAVVFGVASEDSIAWAVTKCLSAAGARIILGYQQCFKSRILQLVKSGEVPVAMHARCDLTEKGSVEQFFDGIEDPVDIVIHSVAYASPETFRKSITQITEEEFVEALVPSAYSLIPMTRCALPRLSRGGSVLAMTYLGGQRVVANYKLMGIAKAALEATVRELAAEVGQRGVRINAISAGPIKTIAASQIKGFDGMLEVFEAVAPMRRAVTQMDVGNMAAFLASDLASNITGQVMFVDAGYSILAMAEVDTAAPTTERPA